MRNALICSICGKPTNHDPCCQSCYEIARKLYKDDSEENPDTPIVCLCGSTRFYDAFQRANFKETMEGRIVLSVGCYFHSGEQAHGEKVGITERQKAELDELHLRKIDLADEILVLNVGGYIGDSTRREIEYARKLGKPVRYLEGKDERNLR